MTDEQINTSSLIQTGVSRDELDLLFNAKKWQDLIAQITSVSGYRQNALLLKYLASAWFYKSVPESFDQAQEAVRHLEKIEPVHAYGMAIDLYLNGTESKILLHYLELRKSHPLTDMDKSWLAYKYGEYYLAIGDLPNAVRLMDEADFSLFYDLMRYEHHFWRNRAAEKPGPEQNEFERANNLLIRAIVETSESLAVEAERLSIGLNYGDLEWYARTVLIKRFGSNTSYRSGIGIRQGTLYWKML